MDRSRAPGDGENTRRTRREVLKTGLRAAGVVFGTPWILAHRASGAGRNPPLEAGQAVVDTTPPKGVGLAGFHYRPGKERRVDGVRQATEARALVLRQGPTQTAIVSVDLCAFGADVAERIQRAVERRTGIPAQNVHLCATHTHSMPAFCYLRQWGEYPQAYAADVERKIVQAVARAKADAAPCAIFVGKAVASAASFNRTTPKFRTEDQFGPDATDADRWLDRTLHTLRFERAGGKPDLLWYHFSAHPVCYADRLAGPDWPGLVIEMARSDGVPHPCYLQGHAGDVNPGPGKPWRGDARETAGSVYAAIKKALAAERRIESPTLAAVSRPMDLPLDLKLYRQWLETYRREPEKCSRGVWVDAGFARDWYQANSRKPWTRPNLPIRLAALRLGPVGLVFHPSELYSFYGLVIQRDSPLPETIVVGYADGLVGYLPDPRAYQAGEYAAIVVPKILDYPPFQPTAAQAMSAGIGNMLHKVASLGRMESEHDSER
ncbi:MAG: hypothetical protein GXP27_02845 [Planctomycetes bacterium]|nr:hypothetical protein [Planctomycetota bacterium]